MESIGETFRHGNYSAAQGSVQREGFDMMRRIAGPVAAALVSGVMGLAAFGVGAGVAQAQPGYYSEPSYGTWCPGQRVPGGFTEVNWDWNVCHDFTTVPRDAPMPVRAVIIGLRTRDSQNSPWYLVAGEDHTPVNCEVLVPGRNDPRCVLG
jgi:hypothetical protein